MRQVLLLIALLGTSTLAIAQPKLVLVEGVVLERTTRAPIPTAKVQFSELIGRPTTDPTVVTGTTGHFAVSLIGGRQLQVYASASGYLSEPPSAGFSCIDCAYGVVVVTLPETGGRVTTEVTLVRVSSLRGIFVDSETGTPVADLSVKAIKRIYDYRDLMHAEKAATTSDADGSFFLDGLPLGDFYLRIESVPKISIEAIPSADAARPAPASSGYGLTYWPGTTANYPENSFVTIAALGTMDLGQVSLKRQNLKSVDGSIDSGCTADPIFFWIYNPADRDMFLDLPIPCGPFRIGNLPEGTFGLRAQVAGLDGRRAQADFQIDAKSVGFLSIRLEEGVVVKGVVEVEGFQPGSWPEGWDHLGLALRSSKDDASGSINPVGAFELRAYPGQPYQIQVSLPLEPYYYVKQIVYNGATVQPSEPLALDASASAHFLRIVIAHK